MSDIPYSGALPASPLPSGPPRYPWWHWRRFGLNFLTISIVAHLLFGLGATYLIVQTIQGKRKQTFAGPPQSPNAPTRAIEHKVQMQKKQQTMSAPAPVKRITTTSNAKVALPAMPAMPKMDSAITPMAMAGMGGTGMSLGMGTGGGGSGGGGGGGGGLSLFGLRDNKGGALAGTLFDFKQTPDQRDTPLAKSTENYRPTDDAREGYRQAVTQYVQGGMNDSSLVSRYFKGPNPLYTTQIYIPEISSDEGPAAFGLAGRVHPSRWIVHYKGSVVAPDTGEFHFVGVADDVLVVRFNNQIVLDCGSMFPSGHMPTKYYAFDGIKPYGWFKGCGEGSPVNVEAGKTYPIDILIGEWPGGQFRASLQVRKEGAEYKQDSHGNPILPLFRTTDVKTQRPRTEAPVFEPDGPVWKAVATPASSL